jgi:hypothetical protein
MLRRVVMSIKCVYRSNRHRFIPNYYEHEHRFGLPIMSNLNMQSKRRDLQRQPPPAQPKQHSLPYLWPRLQEQ